MRRMVTVLALLVAAPGFTLGSAPAAQAATCASSGGVSVVVDYREIGGSTVTGCAPNGGGKSAAAIFAEAGVALSYATRQPGFVCKVNGAPASEPCVNTSPANAYWGLWWADGSKASWTYASYGVGSLTVPAGGSVAWSWQQDRTAGTSVPPAVAPPVTASSTPSATSSPSPSPTSSAAPSPSASSSPGPSGGGGSSSPSPTSPTTGSGGSAGGSAGGSGNGSGNGSGGGGNGPTGGSSTPSSSATPEPTPSAPTVAPESAGDSGDKKKAGKKSEKATDDPTDGGTLAPESPGDSKASETPDGIGPGSESPSDSSASPAPEAGPPSADQPARVPAAITWSIVGLLAVAIAGSAVVARRRRGV